MTTATQFFFYRIPVSLRKRKILQKRFSQFLWFFIPKKEGRKSRDAVPRKREHHLVSPELVAIIMIPALLQISRGGLHLSDHPGQPSQPQQVTTALVSRNIPVGTYLICCCSADPANSVAHPKTISFRLGSRFEQILIRIPASGKTI